MAGGGKGRNHIEIHGVENLEGLKDMVGVNDSTILEISNLSSWILMHGKWSMLCI